MDEEKEATPGERIDEEVFASISKITHYKAARNEERCGCEPESVIVFKRKMLFCEVDKNLEKRDQREKSQHKKQGHRDPLREH